MNLIDKDALKKDVLDLPNCYNGFSDTYDKACIIGVIDEQPTIEECKWIPCSERLPEFRHVINPDPEEDSGWDESPFVVVCFDDGDIECRQFIREDGMVSIYPEEFRGRKGIAWMPLPEPY